MKAKLAQRDAAVADTNKNVAVLESARRKVEEELAQCKARAQAVEESRVKLEIELREAREKPNLEAALAGPRAKMEADLAEAKKKMEAELAEARMKLEAELAECKALTESLKKAQAELQGKSASEGSKSCF